MQLPEINTKILHPTRHRPLRIMAKRGNRYTISTYDHSKTEEQNHITAARKLATSLGAFTEDPIIIMTKYVDGYDLKLIPHPKYSFSD